MTRYRCYVCPPENPKGTGFEFKLEPRVRPVCPQCGTHEDTGNVQRLADVHYEPPFTEQHRGSKGIGFVACDRSKKTGTPGVQSTGNTAAVTCEDCMRSDAWYEDAHKTGHRDLAGRQDAFFYRDPEPAPAPADPEPAPAPADPEPAPAPADPGQ